MSLAADRVLKNILAYCLKKDDAPCSAQTHLDTAIAILANESKWIPEDPAAREIVREAIDSVSVIEAFTNRIVIGGQSEAVR